MVLRVNEKGDPSLYYYQVDDYINECMPLGFVVPSCCTLFEYPAKNFAFELVSPPSYNGLSPRPATHFRFQATNLDEFKSWISVLSLYTMPIEEMYNVARNGIEPVRSHSCESVAQSPLTRSPTNIRSKEWEDNEAVLMKLFPDVELQTIVDALEFCRGNRNDAIDLLAEQNKLSSSTNNKNLVNGLSPQNEVTSGQLKRAKSTMNLSDTPDLMSSPSPFLSPDFSSSELDKDSITPLPPPVPPLSLSGLSLSSSSEEISPSLPPLPSVSVYKPKPLRAISPYQASQSLSLSDSLSLSNPNPLSRSRIHIVPPLQLPLPQTYEPEQTHPHKNQQGQNNTSVQQVHNNSQEKENSIKEEEEDKENHETQYLHLRQLLQKKPISPPNQEISSVPSIPSISSHSSTPQTSPSYEKKVPFPSVSSPSSSSVKKLSPLTIPSSPPPPPPSQHYLYYNQHQQQDHNQNYQPLVSPHSASSLSSSHQPHISISLQSTPHSPLSLESTPRTPQSPSSPTSPTYASPSPRLHHQFTQQYRYSYRSAPSIGGHSTINHFEAYSSPSLDLSDDSSSYHSHSHPGFGGLSNYNIVGSPNSSGGFSPSSPNYGKFQSAINSQNQYKPANPISFRIVGATRNTYYMDYIVEVVTPDLRWLVYRRYSNFSLLNSKLLKMELAHPSKNVMPPKQFSLPSFPPAFASDDLVNRRVDSLGIYLNSLVEDNPCNAKFFLGHPLGQAFINPHITSNEHNKFVNNLPTDK